MKKLADHIRQAHDDAQQVQISSDKITRRFSQIERVELDSPGQIRSLEEESFLDSSPEDEGGADEARA